MSTTQAVGVSFLSLKNGILLAQIQILADVSEVKYMRKAARH